MPIAVAKRIGAVAILAIMVLVVSVTALITPPPAAAQSGCTIDGTAVASLASQAQCDALLALFNSTNGPGWSSSDGWGTGTDPCTWEGVACSDDAHGVCSLADSTCRGAGITEIVLVSAGLQGSIPPEIGALEYLQLLDLSGNSLTGTLPMRSIVWCGRSSTSATTKGACPSPMLTCSASSGCKA